MRHGPAVSALAVLLLTACSGGLPWTSASRSVPLSEAQYCAVGHDLARQVADHVSVRGIILVSPRRRTRCENYTLHYLRRAGFAVDASGASPTFNVELAYAGESAVPGDGVDRPDIEDLADLRARRWRGVSRGPGVRDAAVCAHRLACAGRVDPERCTRFVRR